MRRVLSALCLALLPVLVLAQGEKPSIPETVQLKARILQLESLLAQSQQQQALCDARLVMATSPQLQQQQAKQRAEIEQAAGCPLDWTANPVICKAAKAPKD